MSLSAVGWSVLLTRHPAECPSDLFLSPAFLAEAFARLLKRPPTGFTLFRRDVGFRVNPTLRPEQRLGELAQRLSHAWGVLPEVEKEVWRLVPPRPPGWSKAEWSASFVSQAYRERSRKAYADANEDMRALKASYTATEIWWLSRYTTRGWWHSPRAVLGGVVDVLAQNEPTREELKQRALPRVRPPREVRLKQGMLTAPWRAFVNRWRASHPRPADVKHEAWFKSTVKAASTAWRADRAAEKAAADAAVAAEAAAEQRVVDARVAARREVERVELAKIRVKQGSILVDVRTKSVLADSKQGPPDVERSA